MEMTLQAQQAGKWVEAAQETVLVLALAALAALLLSTFTIERTA
jgi:hypothetical protein